jgi:hypothetical protein
VKKYPNENLREKIENFADEFKTNIEDWFELRDNFSRPSRVFPQIPSYEERVELIDYKLEIRKNMKKIIFSDMKEIAECSTHQMEDIGELSILLQQ